MTWQRIIEADLLEPVFAVSAAAVEQRRQREELLASPAAFSAELRRLAVAAGSPASLEPAEPVSWPVRLAGLRRRGWLEAEGKRSTMKVPRSFRNRTDPDLEEIRL
jgi:hypothetical protein